MGVGEDGAEDDNDDDVGLTEMMMVKADADGTDGDNGHDDDNKASDEDDDEPGDGYTGRRGPLKARSGRACVCHKNIKGTAVQRPR